MPAVADVVGREVRTGKRKPKKVKGMPKLHDYFLSPKTGKPVKNLPPPIKELTRHQLVGEDWGMMRNDRYGDCTIAAVGHAQQITTAVVLGKDGVRRPTDEQVLDAYWATGNPPTPGTDDNGRYETDVLAYWHSAGLNGSKALAYAAIDLKHLHGQVRWSVELFGFAYIGIGLPVTAQSQSRWTVVRNAGADGEPWSWGGHAVIVVDVDRRGCTCITWGTPVWMSWGFFLKYVDEAYTVVTSDWLDAAGRSPAGLDLEGLMTDMRDLN